MEKNLSQTSVMWFRRDLRITDNVALAEAIKYSDKVLLIFILDPQQVNKRSTVNQSAFFASVKQLKDDLIHKDIHLQILQGDLISVFSKIKQLLPNWHNLYFNNDENGYGRLRDQKVAKYCREVLGVSSHSFVDYNLHGATEIKKDNGESYKMFTPYFKKWLQLPKKAPIQIQFDDIRQKNMSLSLTNYDGQLNQLINEHHKYAVIDQVGEASANKLLKAFIQNKISYYEEKRDNPMFDGTSHLSRYLRTGEISIRTIYEAVRQAPDGDGRLTFIKELCWRDYYNMIYANYPDQQTHALRSEFQNIVWKNNAVDFKKWQTGQTGFPLIDAAMRQLNTTGWMHNRLRMIVASFLTKDLLIDWRWGEAYFRDMLVDYDPASNIGGWQWAASTGTDSVPYFRVFNPTLQSKKFDPKGQFIAKFVPELARIKGQKIHEPNLLTLVEQKEYGVKLALTYPSPIVNHKLARTRAIAVYEESKDVFNKA
ncbi:deoxyribodipyrimidine photo-lyase [Leuconostoc sp. MS02]|uniref:Deoxyribodipyrimidine photo-lyase n=1 Tax=Leuconostoc aquikimchii TaxID=3236804 RepID=A0ABV3S5C2_9LACO